MAKNDFQYAGWNSYTLQCGTTLISSGDCTLQCGMWLWNRDSEFTKWQHPAMWHVAVGWHAIEIAQTSAILKFYIIMVSISTHHRSRHVILYQSAKFYPNRTTLGRKKMTSCRFPRWRISAIWDCMDPIMGSLKSPCTTSYRSSIETIALYCLVFEKIEFLHIGVKIQDGGSPPSWILGVQYIGSLKSPCTTSYRSLDLDAKMQKRNFLKN